MRGLFDCMCFIAEAKPISKILVDGQFPFRDLEEHQRKVFVDVYETLRSTPQGNTHSYYGGALNSSPTWFMRVSTRLKIAKSITDSVFFVLHEKRLSLLAVQASYISLRSSIRYYCTSRWQAS